MFFINIKKEVVDILFINEERDKNKIGIYVIANNINGKMYVGKSINAIKERFWVHLATLKNGKHFNSYLLKSFNKYGGENFSFYLLEECNEKIEEKEIYWIAKLETMKFGYNMTVGGDGTSGYVMSKKRKKEIAEFNRKNNLGRKHTEETKAKMSKAHIGTHFSQESIDKANKTKIEKYGYVNKCTEKHKMELSKMYAGSKSNFAKINENDAKIIKSYFVNGKTIKDICELTKYSHNIVKTISNNSRWKHVYCEGWENYVLEIQKIKDKIENDKLNDKLKVIEMWKDGKNCYQIMKYVNRSYDFVKNILIKNNLWQSCANTVESYTVKSND